MRMFESVEPPLELDSCKTCGVIWFDPHEFQHLPESAIEPVETVTLRGIEAEAAWRLEREKAKSEPGGITDTAPDELWKVIPGFFGLPVETKCSGLKAQPWITWGLCLTVAAISIAAFFNLTTVINQFGFIPERPWRWGGLTFLSSFFLHADAWHLIGNLYFLLIFGDNVEDSIGPRRYLLLLLASTLAGDILHFMSGASPDVPCVGASGGISGIIVFYALQFPKAQLGFMFRYLILFRWVHMPAWFALVLWMGLQTLYVGLQFHGISNVAATAHLGGALAGFLLWLLWRRNA